jgi:hypothetical protein
MQKLLEASVQLLPCGFDPHEVSSRHLTDVDITSEVPATHEEVQKYMAMAKGMLIDAMESTIFICNMAPLDHDDPCSNRFLYDTSQDCDSPLEPEFYVSKIQPTRLELCCHCADVFDSPIDLNPSLKALDRP